MKPKILVMLIAGLTTPAVHANTLLWSDNFNVADTTNFDDAPLDGRLSGTLGTAVRLYSAWVQQQIRGNQLRMGPATAGRVRFQTIATSSAWFNWASGTEEATILADGGLRVEFDFTATDLTSTNWISFSIGHAGPTEGEPGTRVNDSATDYGILFRNNGATQRFDNGAEQGVGGTTTPVLTPRHIVLDYAFASFADGTPVKVRATVDGVQVASDNFTWDGNAGALYMELECYNLDGTLFDNYTVSTVPVIYSTALSATSFVSGIDPTNLVAILSSWTYAKGPEASTFGLVAGAGDNDNAKFVINGDRLEAGSYDFTQDLHGQQYFIRVQGAGTVTGGTEEMAYVLTLIKDDDDDKLPDAWELRFSSGLAALNGRLSGPGPGTGTGDFDGDDHSDLAEYNLSLGAYPTISPILADTDNDGLTDKQETTGAGSRPATNPTLADSDNDGLSDQVESNTNTFVDANDSGTNPLLADTDLDGARDGFELARGSVPTDFASRPALPAAFSLLPLTDDASTGISTLKTYTHALSGGPPATINGVVLEEVKPTLIPANFAWTVSAGTRNEMNPINNNQWVPATGGVTGPGLLNLLGGFVYQSSGEPAGFQTYALSGLTVGKTYHLTMFYRPWSVNNLSFRPIDLIFTNGATVEQPFGGLPTDRPGIVLGNGNIHGAFALGYTYVAESTELMIKALVHESAMAASGSNHLYGLTNEVVPVSDYLTWAESFGAALTDPAPTADPDGDGLTNFEEYAFGLIPNSGSSVNPITSPLDKSTGKFSYTRRKPSLGTNLTYSVWFSENLADWTKDIDATEGTPVSSGDNETVEVTLSVLPGNPLPAKLFIQVRAN
jgi:hypothetical protein